MTNTEHPSLEERLEERLTDLEDRLQFVIERLDRHIARCHQEVPA